MAGLAGGLCGIEQCAIAVAGNGKAALKLCAEDPEFGFEFMRRAAQVLAERLAATRMQLLEMGGVRLPEVAIESD